MTRVPLDERRRIVTNRRSQANVIRPIQPTAAPSTPAPSGGWLVGTLVVSAVLCAALMFSQLVTFTVPRSFGEILWTAPLNDR